jgi:prepilin-type N-terminal cleavage/methylation domain-containing protein
MMTRVRRPPLRGRQGMTMIELVVVLFILATLFVLAAAAVSRARLAGNEASAIGALRTVTKAEFAYAADCGYGNYATSLVVLGSKPPHTVQGYLNVDLGAHPTAQTSGYNVTVRRGAGGVVGGRNDCMGNETFTSYYAIATPIEFDKTGRRSFATNQGDAIWQRFSNVPPSEPFGPPAEIVH